jgi:hypothetical protein
MKNKINASLLSPEGSSTKEERFKVTKKASVTYSKHGKKIFSTLGKTEKSSVKQNESKIL